MVSNISIIPVTFIIYFLNPLIFCILSKIIFGINSERLKSYIISRIEFYQLTIMFYLWLKLV